MKLIAASIDRIAVVFTILSIVLYSLFIYVFPERAVGLTWKSPLYFILCALGANLVGLGLSLLRALCRKNNDLRPAKLILVNVAIFGLFILAFLLTNETAIRSDLTANLF